MIHQLNTDTKKVGLTNKERLNPGYILFILVVSRVLMPNTENKAC